MLTKVKKKLVLDLTFTSYIHLQDHQIGQKNVISGATLLTLIATQIGNKCLKNVLFLKPIILSSNQRKVVIFLELDEGIKNFVVSYQNERICMGRTLDDPIPNLETEAKKSRRKKLVEADKVYEFFKNIGYEYGPFFRTISALYYGKNAANSLVNDSFCGEVYFARNSYHFDTIIDGILQSMVFTILKTEDRLDSILVPFNINQFFMDTNFLLDGNFTGSFEVDLSKNSGNFIIKDVSEKIIASGKDVLFRKMPKIEPNLMKINHIEQILLENISSTKKVPLKMPSTLDSIKKIGIRSIACRLPGGISNIEEFWAFIKDGKTADTKIPATRIPTRNDLLKKKYSNPIEGANFISSDIYSFDASFFGISRIEADSMDPQQRLLLEVVYECFENTGLTSFEDTGFFIGVMGSEYPESIGGGPQKDALSMLGSSVSIMAGRLNHIFNSHGPSMAIDTACSSSLVALDLAIDAIKNKRCKRAIVAGVNLIVKEERHLDSLLKNYALFF